MEFFDLKCTHTQAHEARSERVGSKRGDERRGGGVRRGGGGGGGGAKAMKLLFLPMVTGLDDGAGRLAKLCMRVCACLQILARGTDEEI